VRDSGDWKGWLEFFLRGIAEVSVQAAANGHRILEHLYQYPVVSAKQVQALVGATFAAANQIVRRLVNLGVLVEITGQARHRRFRYDAYVKLFDGWSP
jgi:Fic family protein